MSIYVILNIIGILITIFFGVWALVRPKTFARLVSLTPYRERGITEIRSTSGGWIIGLCTFTLIYQEPLLFSCLGAGWISTALVRIISMLFIDNSNTSTNIKFVIVELIVGILLLL